MHFVDCGDEPACLVRLRNSQPDPDWDKANTRPVKDYLGKKFNNLCGYCERFCRGAENTDSSPSVDHFEPKGRKGTPRYRRLAFKWDNLVYACLRCNTKVKKDRFPAGEDLRAYEGRLDLIRPQSEIKRLVEKFRKPFLPISEKEGYVNPRDDTELAENFFAFNAAGDILPVEDLPNDRDDPKWSKAVRTIADLELNPDNRGRLRTGLVSQRATLWKVAKGLSEDPALAQMPRPERDQELEKLLGKKFPFPTLVNWVLDHPD